MAVCRCGKDPIELLSLVTAAMEDQRIDEVDAYGNAPLHLAAMRGATICCIHLLQVVPLDFAALISLGPAQASSATSDGERRKG